MSIRIENENGIAKVFVNSDLTIYTANDFKQHLVALLEGNEILDVNLKNVGEIDTAGFQMLLLIKREAERLNKRLHLSEASLVAHEIMELLNIDQILDVDRRTACQG